MREGARKACGETRVAQFELRSSGVRPLAAAGPDRARVRRSASGSFGFDRKVLDRGSSRRL